MYFTKAELKKEVVAVQSGNRMSPRFAEIVEIMAHSVWKQYGSDYRTDDFEEFNHDCIVRVLKAVPKITVGQRCCAAYLWTACRNVLMARHRRRLLWLKWRKWCQTA